MNQSISISLAPHELERISAELYNSRHTNGIDVDKFIRLKKSLGNRPCSVVIHNGSSSRDEKKTVDLKPHEIEGILSSLKVTSKKGDRTLWKFKDLSRSLNRIVDPHCFITKGVGA